MILNHGRAEQLFIEKVVNLGFFYSKSLMDMVGEIGIKELKSLGWDSFLSQKITNLNTHFVIKK